MNNIMKTIILNQGTLHPSYQSVDNAAYNTWGSTQNPDVRVIHYYGKYNHHNILTDRFPILPDDGNIILDNQTMVIGTYDTTYPSEHPRYDIIPDARNEKFILALEYCVKNFEFDYIQRISNTTYVDVEKMQLYLNEFPKTKIYNGARNMGLGIHNQQIYFVSGHDVIMSRDVVELLVNYKDRYLKSPYPEDAAAGEILIHDTQYVNFDNQSNDNFFDLIPYDININDIKLSLNPSVWCYKIGRRPEIFDHIHKLVLEKNNI